MAVESAVCQILSDGKWFDFARTTPERALQWIAERPEQRRAHDWISHDPIEPPDTTVTERIAARANFMFAGARALHELEWAHDMDVCPVCQEKRS